MNTPETNCQHGYTIMHETVMDSDERSACCGAPCSIYTDSAEWYCKCCHATVVGGEHLEGVSIDLRDEVGNCGRCLRPLDIKNLHIVRGKDFMFSVCPDCARRYYR